MKPISSINAEAGCDPRTGPFTAVSVSHVGALFRAGGVLAPLEVSCGLLARFPEVLP